jgi:hypothetical protein
MKSEAIRLVSELVERANNQADTIDSRNELIGKLNKQLEDKYSTETHLLVSRETLDGFIDKFEELSDEFKNLDGLLDDISGYADSIRDDSSYNDASRYGDWASGYAEEIRELLKVETEGVA